MAVKCSYILILALVNVFTLAIITRIFTVLSLLINVRVGIIDLSLLST